MPAASEVGAVIDSVGRLIVNDRELDAVALAESVTVAFTVYEPCVPAAGVPLNTPAALRLMPVGNPVADQVYPVSVPPVAVNVTEG